MSTEATVENSVTIDGATFKIKTQISKETSPGGGNGKPTQPPLPASCQKQDKGASADPETWKPVAMTSDPSKYKVVDAASINVCDQCSSQQEAQQYIDHYVWEKLHGNDNPPPPPNGGGNGGNPSPVEGETIYAAKKGGYVSTKMTESGGPHVSDGQRFNFSNKKTVINKETKWIIEMLDDQFKTDKPWWSPKVGSHGKEGQKSCYTEMSAYYKGGFKSCRTEGPHPKYHSIPNNAIKQYDSKNIPKIPINKKLGFIVAQFLKGPNYITQYFYDWENEGKGPYKKLCEVFDTPSGVSGIAPLEKSGDVFVLVGEESICKETFRGNGMNAKFHSGGITEIEVPDNIK